MRYIKVPHAWVEEDNNIYTTDLRINPFSIEAYHPSMLDYFEDEIPLSTDVTTVITRSSLSYHLLLDIKEFEMIIEQFNKQ